VDALTLVKGVSRELAEKIKQKVKH